VSGGDLAPNVPGGGGGGGLQPAVVEECVDGAANQKVRANHEMRTLEKQPLAVILYTTALVRVVKVLLQEVCILYCES
jgi:hypothetical protein